jgi:hypothetical protein
MPDRKSRANRTPQTGTQAATGTQATAASRRRIRGTATRVPSIRVPSLPAAAIRVRGICAAGVSRGRIRGTGTRFPRIRVGNLPAAAVRLPRISVAGTGHGRRPMGMIGTARTAGRSEAASVGARIGATRNAGSRGAPSQPHGRPVAVSRISQGGGTGSRGTGRRREAANGTSATRRTRGPAIRSGGMQMTSPPSRDPVGPGKPGGPLAAGCWPSSAPRSW